VWAFYVLSHFHVFFFELFLLQSHFSCIFCGVYLRLWVSVISCTLFFKFAFSYFLQLLKLAHLNYLWMYFSFFSCVGLLCLHVWFLSMFFIFIFFLFFYFLWFDYCTRVSNQDHSCVFLLFHYKSIVFFLVDSSLAHFFFIDSKFRFVLNLYYFLKLLWMSMKFGLFCHFFVLLQFFCQIDLTSFILDLESWFVNTNVDWVFTFG
jgi:hypothetical protein